MLIRYVRNKCTEQHCHDKGQLPNRPYLADAMRRTKMQITRAVLYSRCFIQHEPTKMHILLILETIYIHFFHM